MSIGKFLGAALGGGAVMWLVGGLWHALIMEDFYAANSAATGYGEPRMLFIILGYAILGVLMAYIYPKGYAGGGGIGEGLRFGVIVGILWTLPHGVVMHGVQLGATGKLILVDVVWHMVEQGIGGIAIALIYGLHSSADQAEGAESTE